MLKVLKLENATGKIVLQIENPLFKSMFENMMRIDGTIVDYSFNKDIIKIDENAFALILEHILTEDEKIDVMKKIKKNQTDFNL